MKLFISSGLRRLCEYLGLKTNLLALVAPLAPPNRVELLTWEFLSVMRELAFVALPARASHKVFAEALARELS